MGLFNGVVGPAFFRPYRDHASHLHNPQRVKLSSEAVPMLPANPAADRQSVPAQALDIRLLRPGDDATAFRTLNEEWIVRHFALEPKDVETLADPESTIISKGGHILMAHAGAEAVACVALIPNGPGVFEISKMAVSPQLRGQGIGRRLLQQAIAHARNLGATSLFLGSSTKLPAAVHLYESVGFSHVPPHELPPNNYARTDVFMRLTL